MDIHKVVIKQLQNCTCHPKQRIINNEVFMNKEKSSPVELWRWKMIRKVADYINEPDDITMSELKAMIESYRDYHNIKGYTANNFN